MVSETLHFQEWAARVSFLLGELHQLAQGYSEKTLIRGLAEKAQELLLQAPKDVAPCPACSARRKKALEDAGWTPVSEFLAQAETHPLMVILNQINATVFQEVVGELNFYAGRPAFFNETTHDLIECGGWDDLWRHEHGEEEP